MRSVGTLFAAERFHPLVYRECVVLQVQFVTERGRTIYALESLQLPMDSPDVHFEIVSSVSGKVALSTTVDHKSEMRHSNVDSARGFV